MYIGTFFLPLNFGLNKICNYIYKANSIKFNNSKKKLLKNCLYRARFSPFTITKKHPILRIELIAINQRRFIHFLLYKYFSIKMILKNGVSSRVDGQDSLLFDSRGIKLDALNDWKWTVLCQSERPWNKKVDGPKR